MPQSILSLLRFHWLVVGEKNPFLNEMLHFSAGEDEVTLNCLACLSFLLPCLDKNSFDGNEMK
jgi:hypothetical protein